MRVLLDTNIIMDVLLKRETFFEDSYAILKLSAQEHVEAFVSASAITDIFYLLRKGMKNNAQQAKDSVERLLQIVDIANTLGEDVYTALASNLPDFEDALVSAIADRYKADYIVTRNIKDFMESSVKAISPSDFLAIPQ